MIAKHMFPLTVTPPKYKETFVIVLVDKFCSFNEVLDDLYTGSSVEQRIQELNGLVQVRERNDEIFK